MAKPKLVDMNAEVKRLVELTSLEYDQQREAAANKLGVRVATLDMEVKAARPPAEDDTAQGKALEFKEVEPWDEEVDGVAMLDDIVALIRRHVVLDKKKAYAVTLWTVSTHTLAAASYAPRLWLWSPTKRCGKTTLLSTVSRLVLRPLPASNVSPAALFRAIEAFSPTVLIDEADAMDMHDEMRALLNSGHSREMAFVIRTVGDNHEPRQFKTFAAIALASKGKKMPDTVADRSIAIEMRRRKRDKAGPGAHPTTEEGRRVRQASPQAGALGKGPPRRTQH